MGEATGDGAVINATEVMAQEKYGALPDLRVGARTSGN